MKTLFKNPPAHRPNVWQIIPHWNESIWTVCAQHSFQNEEEGRRMGWTPTDPEPAAIGAQGLEAGTTSRLHDSSSRSLWLSLSLRYLPIRELSAELKAPRGEPVTQYTAHCCAHISNCQDATFSPVKRQTPELGKHQTPSKLVTESIWAEAGGMRKPHSQGHVQVQVSYLRGSNTRHRCCLW